MKYKNQLKESDDVILNLTRDNDEAMKQMLDLENKITILEKKNEKS